MRIISLALYLTWFLSARSQTTISGHVEDAQLRQPLLLVSINANIGNAKTESDNAGNFILRLPSGKKGDPIWLRVEKIGYITWSRIIAISPEIPQMIYLFRTKNKIIPNKVPAQNLHSHNQLARLKNTCLQQKDALSCSLAIEAYENKFKPLISSSFLSTSRDPQQMNDYADYLLSLDKTQRAFFNIYLSKQVKNLDIFEKRRMLSQANEIIFNSEKTMNDIIEKYNLSCKK
jgi:hypothetical protein